MTPYLFALVAQAATGTPDPTWGVVTMLASAGGAVVTILVGLHTLRGPKPGHEYVRRLELEKELTGVGERQGALHEYAHSNIHRLGNELNSLSLRVETNRREDARSTDQKLDRINDKLDKLIAQRGGAWYVGQPTTPEGGGT